MIDDVKQRIDAWDPSTGDLPDDIALAMDDHAELRAHFDARFARWLPEVAEAPPGALADRVMPPRTRRRRWPWVMLVATPLGAVAMALISVLSVVGSDSEPLHIAEPSVVASETQVGRRGDLSSPQLQVPRDGQQEQEATSGGMLLQLGYITGDDVLPTQPDVRALEERRPAAPPRVPGFVRTVHDPHSTFAVDVDTASYTLARRRLREGFWPAPETIRVEEFVNFVHYDYPGPDDSPFAVQFEASPSPFSDLHLVRIGIQGRVIPDAERPPVHLTFLIDTSGSMQGPDRLGLVQWSLHQLVRQLGDGDTVAIVTYAGSAGVVLPTTSARDAPTILEALSRLTAGGSTAMGSGIREAYRLASASRREGHVSRVILASDGDANVGIVDTDRLTEEIAAHASEGVTLTTLGFGVGNLRDGRMEQLADRGDGSYHYIDGRDEAERVLVDGVTGTLVWIAKDVKIQVAFDPASVIRYRLIGYENRAVADRDFRNDAVDAGEIGSGYQVTALYEVQLADPPAGDLATVRIRAAPPGPDAPATERSWALPAFAVQPSFDAASADHRLSVVVATFAELLRQSPHVSGVSMADLLDEAAEIHRSDHPEDAEIVELMKRSLRLQAAPR